MGVLDDPADGTPADSPEALLRPDDLVVAIARFLHRLHGSRPVDGAIEQGPQAFLARARARVAAGEVDGSSFDAPYRPHAPERLVRIAGELADRLAERPDASDGSPVHGGLSLGDLRIDGGRVVGWAVPEAPLVGDPYVDLTFVARDLAASIGPAAVPALFDAYGVEHPDPIRIEFWITVRQLL